MQLNIGFYVTEFTFRGTCTSLYDYADYNEKILGNKSIIISSQKELVASLMKVDNMLAYLKFLSRFNVFLINSTTQDPNIKSMITSLDYVYTIHYGRKSDSEEMMKILNLYKCSSKVLIHCVFDMSENHGDKYIAVSKNVALKYKYFYDDKVVHHMISIPNDDVLSLRQDLKIPENARVFGYHGGYECFNIDFVKNVIKNILAERSDIFFIFMGPEKFYEHDNIKYLTVTSDTIFKKRFIISCDAMLHAQILGETFGQSCGEFASCNKPVITYNNTDIWNRAHIDILSRLEQCRKFFYSDYDSLYTILNNFTIEENIDYNAYSFYTPENIMNEFKNNFL